MNPIMSFLQGLVKPVTDLIGKAVPDKDLAANLNQQVTLAILGADASALSEQAGIITAEAKGESWLQRNWRPLIMCEFGLIIFFNYIGFPILRMFHLNIPDLPTPQDLWDLMKLGLGGYVVGRSGEKIARVWAAGKAASSQGQDS